MKLTGTGSRPSRSSCEHALASLSCQGRIPLGIHRGSIVYLWNIPVDRSFQRRVALQLSTKVAKPIVQRSSVSQQHVGYRIILHWKRFWIKSEVATTYDLNVDFGSSLMGDAGRRTSVFHLDPNVLNYRLLKTTIKKSWNVGYLFWCGLLIEGMNWKMESRIVIHHDAIDGI